MEQKTVRKIFFYRKYFHDFYHEQPEEVRRKFNWTLQLISTLEIIPRKYFQHMEGTDGIFEIRVEVNSNIYRAFSFFDKGQLIIIANAFQKKPRKRQRMK